MLDQTTSNPMRITSTDLPVQLKPLRLNFAGVCIYCGERGCQAEWCISAYARSLWAVCAKCDGTGTPKGFDFGNCSCLFGLEEASALGAAESAAAWAASAPVPGSGLSGRAGVVTPW